MHFVRFSRIRAFAFLAMSMLALTSCAGNTNDSGSSALESPSSRSPVGITTRITPTPIIPYGALAESGLQNRMPIASFGEGAIYGLTWSADGSSLLAAGAQGIWQYTASELEMAPELLPFPAVSVVFSPDGSLIAAADRNGQVQVWNAVTKERVRTLEAAPREAIKSNIGPASFSLPVFNAASTQLALQREGSIQVWNLNRDTSTPQVFDIPEERLLGVGFASDGSLLAAGSVDNLVKPSGDGVISPADQPDDFSIRIYTVVNGDKVSELNGATGPANNVIFMHEGTRVAGALQGALGTGTGATAMLWDVGSGVMLGELALASLDIPGANRIVSIADGLHLITFHEKPVTQVVGPDSDREYYFGVWEVGSGSLVTILKSSSTTEVFPETIAYDFTGNKLAVLDTTDAVLVWSLPDYIDTFAGQPTPLGRPTRVTNDYARGFVSVNFAANGGRVTARTWKGSVHVWNATSGVSIEILPSDEYEARMSELGVGLSISPYDVRAVSPDGKLVAEGRGSAALITIHARDTGDTVSTLLPTYQVSAVAFSPNGDTLASGGADGTISLWEYKSHDEYAVFRGHTSRIRQLLYSPDGNWLFSLSGSSSEKSANTLNVWNPGTGELIAIIVPDSRETLNGMSINPSGTLLAIAMAGEESYIALFDLTSLQIVSGLAVGSFEVNGMAFSPDGSRIAAAGSDGRVYLWDVP